MKQIRAAMTAGARHESLPVNCGQDFISLSGGALARVQRPWPRARLHPPGQPQPGSADDENHYFISPRVILGLPGCQPLCVCARTLLSVWFLIVFAGLGGRWGRRCSFSCTFHDHYISRCMLPVHRSKPLLKPPLETEIFSSQ